MRTLVKKKLEIPVTYQGGKQRIAGAILDQIRPFKYRRFYDLCCGSGAVSIELVNRGYDPASITMVDSGPWGAFWQLVGTGTFNLDRFQEACDAVPKDKRLIKSYVDSLFRRRAEKSRFVYDFLLIQATAFGGAAVWTEKGEWKKSGGFRDYWEPTATSSRRSPVNPMMPMPDSLFTRVETICQRMKYVNAIRANVLSIKPQKRSVAYIDPPYEGTVKYGKAFSVVEYAESISVPCYVSEGKPLTKDALQISASRTKGGMNGSRSSKQSEEWLSAFNKSA